MLDTTECEREVRDTRVCSRAEGWLSNWFDHRPGRRNIDRWDEWPV